MKRQLVLAMLFSACSSIVFGQKAVIQSPDQKIVVKLYNKQSSDVGEWYITSYGHELALSVLFESGMQHLADRPEGYYELPDATKTFLKHVPNAWDDVKLLDGYPGKEVIIARRKGNDWYIGGINGEQKEKTKTVKFDFLPDGVKYKLTLIADGKHDKAFATQYLVVHRSGSVDVKMLRRGGFAASLAPMQ